MSDKIAEEPTLYALGMLVGPKDGLEKMGRLMGWPIDQMRVAVKGVDYK